MKRTIQLSVSDGFLPEDLFPDTDVTVEVDLEVDPGFRGSHSYHAPSDIDYYGQAPSVEVMDVRLLKTGTSTKPTDEQSEAVVKYCESQANLYAEDDDGEYGIPLDYPDDWGEF